MRKTTLAFAVSALVFAGQSAALAQSSHSISPKLSTLGAGVEYMYRYSDQLSFGAGAYGLGFNRTFTQNAVNFDTELRLFNAGAFAQYNPWDMQSGVALAGVHFKGGVIFNQNKATLSAQPSAARTLTFAGRTYQASVVGDVDGEVTFNKVAPYLGVGWSSGDSSQEGLAFTADVGVMFTGKPKLSLSESCDDSQARTNPITGETINPCVQFRADVERERVRFQDRLDKLKAYPVASIGLIYRF